MLRASSADQPIDQRQEGDEVVTRGWIIAIKKSHYRNIAGTGTQAADNSVRPSRYLLIAESIAGIITLALLPRSRACTSVNVSLSVTSRKPRAEHY